MSIVGIPGALDIAASGLRAAQDRLAVSASNVANVNTDGFRASRVVATPATGGGVQTRTVDAGVPNPVATDETGRLLVLSNTDITTETVERISATHAFYANLAVVRASDETTRTLIDMLG